MWISIHAYNLFGRHLNSIAKKSFRKAWGRGSERDFTVVSFLSIKCSYKREICGSIQIWQIIGGCVERYTEFSSVENLHKKKRTKRKSKKKLLKRCNVVRNTNLMVESTLMRPPHIFLNILRYFGILIKLMQM